MGRWPPRVTLPRPTRHAEPGPDRHPPKKPHSVMLACPRCGAGPALAESFSARVAGWRSARFGPSPNVAFAGCRAQTSTPEHGHSPVSDLVPPAQSTRREYKAECIRTTVFHEGPYKTLADVEYATAGWVDWYTTRRLHASLGNVPPIEYEQAHYAALNREPHPV